MGRFQWYSPMKMMVSMRIKPCQTKNNEDIHGYTHNIGWSAK
jgi:hypothetical protein